MNYLNDKNKNKTITKCFVNIFKILRKMSTIFFVAILKITMKLTMNFTLNRFFEGYDLSLLFIIKHYNDTLPYPPEVHHL